MSIQKSEKINKITFKENKNKIFFYFVAIVRF